MASKERLVDANSLWSDIMMLPHNGDIISSEKVEQAIKNAPTVDVTVQRWISVTEKLPTEKDATSIGHVLAQGREGNIQTWFWTTVVNHPDWFTRWTTVPEPPKKGCYRHKCR